MTAAAMTQLPPEELEALQESVAQQEDQVQERIEQITQDLLSELKRTGDPNLYSLGPQNPRDPLKAVRSELVQIGFRRVREQIGCGSYEILAEFLLWWGKTYTAVAS